MKKILLLITICPLFVISQVTGWAPKPTLPDSARGNSFYFQINDKFYVGGGQKRTNPQILNDFWEYNATTDTWTKKNDFTGPARAGAAGFSYNGKGYIVGGTNYTTTTAFKDIWEYNPLTDTWIQKTSLPITNGMPHAYGYVVGNKAYVGGLGINFYEYNFSSDSWSSKPNPLITPYQTSTQGFCVGNSVYMLTDSGLTAPFIYTQLYEFNTITNIWSKKNKPPFDSRYGSCVSYDNCGFIIGGNAFGSASTVYYQSIFKKYSPSNDTWSNANPTTVPSSPYETGNGIIFAYKNRIYYGLGFQQGTSNLIGQIPYTNSFWQTTFDVGISTLKLNNILVSIYPIPCDNECNIEINGVTNNHEDLKIELLNMLGVSFSTTYYFNSNINDSKIHLNTNYLEEGIYFVKISNIDNSICTKLLIQH